MQIISIIRRFVGANYLGFVGQALNFVAMLVPVVLGRRDEVAFLVVVSAGSMILTQFATLSFSGIFPTVARDKLTVSIQASALILVGTSLLVAVSATVLVGVSPDIGEYLVWIALLLLCQGAYSMCAAALVRHGDAPLYARFRFFYGLTNLVVTGAVCLTIRWPPSLALATCAVYAVLIGVGALLLRHHFHGSRIAAIRQVVLLQVAGYVRSCLGVAVGSFIASLSFQMSSFTVPMMGPYSAPWAAVLRVGGGFGTVSQQVVAPAFEMAVGRAVRANHTHRVAAEVKRALMLGALIGIPATGLSVMIAVMGSDSPAAPKYDVSIFGLCAAIYIFSMIAPSIIARYIVLIGERFLFLVWALTKSICIAALLVFGRQVSLLIGFAFIELIFAGIYVVLLLTSRRLRPTMQARHVRHHTWFRLVRKIPVHDSKMGWPASKLMK